MKPRAKDRRILKGWELYDFSCTYNRIGSRYGAIVAAVLPAATVASADATIILRIVAVLPALIEFVDVAAALPAAVQIAVAGLQLACLYRLLILKLLVLFLCLLLLL